MTARARLTLAGIVAVGGAALAAAGTTSRWFSVVEPGRTLDVPGYGRAEFPPKIFNASASDVAGAAPGIAVIVLLLALLAFLAGRTGRLVLLGGVVAGAVALIVLTLQAGPGDAVRAAPRDVIASADPQVHQGPGIPLTLAGAGIALAGGLAAVPASRGVGRVRLPEGAPDQGAPER